MRFIKRDVVLWLKHLQEAGMPVPAGYSAVFRVGGQTLLGVPVLARLRDDDQLCGFSAVWPFETGCRLRPRDKPRIVFAEIYLSLVKLPADAGGRVKDSVQVEAIARHLARHDAFDTLGDLFAAPALSNPPFGIASRRKKAGSSVLRQHP